MYTYLSVYVSTMQSVNLLLVKNVQNDIDRQVKWKNTVSPFII